MLKVGGDKNSLGTSSDSKWSNEQEDPSPRMRIERVSEFEIKNNLKEAYNVVIQTFEQPSSRQKSSARRIEPPTAKFFAGDKPEPGLIKDRI